MNRSVRFLPEGLPPEIRRSLDISWKEGIPAALMLGIMDTYLIPFGLFLGASAREIGFLIAFPHLFASLAQLFAVHAVQAAGSRLKFLLRGIAVQILLLAPIGVLAFFPFRGRILVLAGLVVLYRVIGNLIGTAWSSLVSDYLPSEKRGNYLGWRARIAGISNLTGIALAGSFLYAMKKVNPSLGFFCLFSTAVLARMISRLLMGRMADLPAQISHGSDFTFWMFLRRFRQSNFVKFVFYTAGMMFTAYLSAPFMSVYALRDLHIDYLAYTAIQVCSMIAGLLAFPIWGRHADMIGNAAVLRTASFLIAINPFLWLVSKNAYALMGAEFFSGFAWGAFNLCTVNFVFDAVSPAKRVRCLGYFSLINGIALFAGTSIGGLLADRVHFLPGPPLLSLILISGTLRFAAHFALSGKFQEVRPAARKVSSLKLFFSVVGLEPLTEEKRPYQE